MKFFSVFVFAITAVVAVAEDASDHPPCEICGCSWCEEGSFAMTNPQGLLNLEEFLLEYDDMITREMDNQTVSELMGEMPLDAIPCFLLDMGANAGGVAEEYCIDHFRLNPVLRNSCGCPALPPAPPGVVNMFEDRAEATEPESTEPEPTEPGPTSNANPPCPMCGCSWCEEGLFPMTNPQGIIDVEDWYSVYELPEDADETFAELMVDLPVKQFPCSLLDSIGRNGGLTEDQCVDEVRLNPVMRDVCGCPPLPPLPAGVVNVFEDETKARAPETSEDEETTTDTMSSPEDEDVIVLEGSKNYITIVLVLLVAVALLGGLFYFRKHKKEQFSRSKSDETVGTIKLSVIA